MLKKIFTLDYNPKQLKNFLEFSLSGTIAANIIAPFVACYLLFDFIPHTFLYIFMVLSIFIFGLRFIFANRLSYSIKLHDEKKMKGSLKVIFLLILMTALLYTPLLFVCVLYDVSDLYILTIGVLIISLAAGAVSTLSSIFTAFFIYVFFTVLPLFCFMLYLGGTIFNTFAFILFVFTSIILSAGYRQFTILKNSYSLEDTFQTIYEKSSDGVIIIKDGSFEDCNESIVKMIGCKNKEDFLKLAVTDLSPQFQPDGQASVEKAQELMKVAFQKGFNSFEWLHKRYNGEEFWAEIVLTKIYLNGENLLHVVMRDVSQRKKRDALLLELNLNLEEKVESAVNEVRQKDKLLQEQHSLAQMGEMLSMIAHQWRQPLAAIASTNSALSLKAHLNKLDKDTTIQLSNEMNIYIKHLSDTIDDFKDFFKPDRGMSITNYDELVYSIIGIVKSSIEDKKIELIKELECKNKFNTYSHEVKQVILNLIKNAEDILIENDTEKRWIKIKTYKKDEKCVLEISDNGGGIPKDILPKIFNPYFSTKTKKNGTGLGLYMSKKIVEDHCNGKLLASNGPDGAVFKIILGDLT